MKVKKFGEIKADMIQGETKAVATDDNTSNSNS